MWSVDWWTLGILAYEMLYGSTPFEARTSSEAFKNILHKDAAFGVPPGCSEELPDDAIDMLTRLLVKNPEKRAGTVGGKDGSTVRSLAIFDEVEWEALLAKKLPSPWSPVIGAVDDARNFDEYEEESERAERKPGRELEPWAARQIADF
jgi:serine/threonine protein kinase